MIERILRGVAGINILIGVLLIGFVDKRFIWFIVFIGLNLLQSVFTNWCPGKLLLWKLGVK